MREPSDYNSFYFDPTYEDDDMIFCYQCELPILDRPIFHKWDINDALSFCNEYCRDKYFEDYPDEEFTLNEVYLDSLADEEGNINVTTPQGVLVLTQKEG